MPRFAHDGVEIAFLDEGEGEPIVLVHGFASDKEVNWVFPGWVTTLTRAGRRVIALDNRGHGESTKLYEPAAYHSADHGRGRARAHRSSRPRPCRCHGLFDGRADHRVPGAGAPGARALRDPRRARHHLVEGVGLDRKRSRRRSRLPSRADVADPTALHVPHLRRADEVRPAGARRLHARLAPDAEQSRGRPHRRAGAGRGRQQRPHRGLAGSISPRSFPARRRWSFPAAITCSRSATGYSRRRYWISWRSGREAAR